MSLPAKQESSADTSMNESIQESGLCDTKVVAVDSQADTQKSDADMSSTSDSIK